MAVLLGFDLRDIGNLGTGNNTRLSLLKTGKPTTTPRAISNRQPRHKPCGIDLYNTYKKWATGETTAQAARQPTQTPLQRDIETICCQQVKQLLREQGINQAWIRAETGVGDTSHIQLDVEYENPIGILERMANLDQHLQNLIGRDIKHSMHIGIHLGQRQSKNEPAPLGQQIL